MKGTILLLTLIALQLLLVSAQQPFQQSDITTGLQLEVGIPTTHQLGDDYYLHTHVYNATNGLLITSGLDCYYHFYNHQINGGEHISVGNLSQYGMGYFNYVNGSLINQTGEYSALLWCNSTTEGGFIAYRFEVTPSGSRIELGESIIIASSLFVMIIIGILFFWVATFYNNRLSRITFYTFSSIIFLMTILYTVVIIQQTMYSFEAILTSIDTFWFVISVGVWLGFLALLIVIFFVMLKAWKIKRGYYE